MNILILGGTGFLGPHIVDAALAAGHTVTLFNRSKTNAAKFPQLETLVGDRDPDKSPGLTALSGRSWDAAIDVCGYVPRVVGASARLLAPHIRQYVFISSISVYSDLSQSEIDENSPVGKLDDPTTEKITGETYGPLKVLCEHAAEAAMPGRMICIRPGLIVGPGDHTDRFTYWPVRISRGGEVLAPGDPHGPVQIIDVRDLANFILHTAEAGAPGTWNAVGPQHRFAMREMLEACQAVVGSSSQLKWVDADFLLQQGVQPWSEIPLWIPDTPEMRGFARISNASAVSAGLQFRPFAETARDTLEWFNKLDQARPLKAGISAERERQLLDEWSKSGERKP